MKIIGQKKKQQESYFNEFEEEFYQDNFREYLFEYTNTGVSSEIEKYAIVNLKI